MRPTESGTRCSLAVRRSLRFIARTKFSRSSCGPTPTCELEDAEGPHCFGGALLTERRCVADNGLRLRVAGSVGDASFPKTFVARPWIADQEFPHNPDNVADVSRSAFGACALADRTKDDGFEVVFEREGWVLGMGDAVREPNGEAPVSLPETVPSSSSIDIRRRVRGRNVEAVSVELVLDEDALVGFMAFRSPAELVKEEQHRIGLRSGRESAWHQVTVAFSKYLASVETRRR